jgi:hypothetical protein
MEVTILFYRSSAALPAASQILHDAQYHGGKQGPRDWNWERLFAVGMELGRALETTPGYYEEDLRDGHDGMPCCIYLPSRLTSNPFAK